MHGRGLATRLLEQLAEIAAARAITRFDAEVMAGNRAMLGVFAGAGFDTQRQTEFGEVHLSLDLRPTERFEERMADRTHVAAVASLRPLLAPASVAVVGASAARTASAARSSATSSPAASPASRCRCTPSGGVVASTRAARSLSDLAEAPELAVVAVPAAEVLGVVREAARCGVRALLVVSAGFSDSDEPEGREREEARARRRPRPRAAAGGAQRAGRRQHRAGREPARAHRPRRRGPGGSRCRRSRARSAWRCSGHAAARGLGISSFVALGNRADVSTNDLLEHWADDERTAVVALYMESFGNPRRFSQVSRRVSRRKPILAVKGGRGRPARRRGDRRALPPGRRAARRDDADAVRRRRAARAPAAAARAPGRRGDELRRSRRGRGRRVRGARPRARGARRATRARLAAALPGADRLGNPIDLGVRAPVADDLEAIAALLDDDHVDAVLVLHVELGAGDPARACRRSRTPRATPPSRCSRAWSAPAASCRGARSWRVPNYRFPEAAVRALALAADRRDWLSRPLGQAPVVEGLDLEAARALVAAARARARSTTAGRARC